MGRRLFRVRIGGLMFVFIRWGLGMAMEWMKLDLRGDSARLF